MLKKNFVLCSVLLFIAVVVMSGCIGGDTTDDVPQSEESDISDSQSDGLSGQVSNQGYTVFDEAIDFGTVYTASASQGDVVDISASTTAAALYICLDEEGYNSLLEGNVDESIGDHIIDEFSSYDAETYSQSIAFRQDGDFYLLILASDDTKPISGHINAVRYSSDEQATSSKDSADEDSDTGDTGYTPHYYTDANEVAEKSKELAERARALSDQWEEDRLVDDADYF